MSAATTPAPARHLTGAGQLALYDRAFYLLCLGAALLVLVVAALLLFVLVDRSWQAIQAYGLSFLTETEWAPNSKPPSFGSLIFVYGTVVTSVIAMLIAVPLGVGTAAYLSEIASPGVRRVASFFIEMLAAIPSVVYGFWGIMVLAPMMAGAFRFFGADNQSGAGLLAAGLVLAVMIVPYIAAISYDVCQAVPRSQREGALALGATRWQTIWNVVLPYARPGIIAGAFLALGRALGETMAVTMLIGSNPDGFENPITGTGVSLASKLATQYNGATSDLLRSVLVELGLVLMMVTVLINALARVVLDRFSQQKPIFPFLSWFTWPSQAAATRPEQPVVPAGGAAPAPSPPRTRAPLKASAGLFGAEAMNSLMTYVLGACVAFTMSMLVVILAFLVYKGAGALDWNFFTEVPAGDVRRGTTVEATLTRDYTLAEMQEKLGGPGALTDQQVGPDEWEKAGPQDWFEFFIPEPDAERADQFLKERLGKDLKKTKAEVRTGGGLAHAIVGSLLLVCMAALFAVPVGLLAAIYLAEYQGGWLASTVRFVSEQLGAVPSIVVGIFAAAAFSLATLEWKRRFGWEPNLYGWMGVFALAVMMVPIVMRAAEEALKLVPLSLRNASYALGASQAQTVLHVVMPAALPAIITAVFLSIARIAGETAPLLLTVGENRYWPGGNTLPETYNPFAYVAWFFRDCMSDFMPALPVYIYRYGTSASELWKQQAWAAAFVLMVMVLVLNFGIRLVTGPRIVSASRAD